MRDILIDDSGNILCKNNDLELGDARQQIVQQVVNALTGEYKAAPTIGGNAKRMIAGRPDPFWLGHIKRQLKQCLVEASVRMNGENIEIIL